MSKVVVFMADGMEMCECLITVDLLRRAGIEVITAAVRSDNNDKCTMVMPSHKVGITADVLAEDVDYSSVDMIVLPGGRVGTENLAASEMVTGQVRSFANEGKWIAAICAAPSVFAGLGLLEGKDATCHPDFAGKMRGAVVHDEHVVVNGNIVTGQALGATFDFAFKLVNILAGEETENRIRKSICY